MAYVDVEEAPPPVPAKKPKPKKAKGPAKMSEADFASLVKHQIEDAISFVETDVKDDREKATKYYRGTLPDVDKDTAEEDRSQVVLSEVSDTVLGIMPDLLRIFFSAESVVRYKPVGPGSEDFAKQATEYVNSIVLNQDNRGYSIIQDAFQDALVRKTGFVKYWWAETKEPIFRTHTGLDEMQLTALAGSDDVEILAQRTYIDEDAVLGPAVLYDIEIKTIVKGGKIKLAAVPCEEVFLSRYTRDAGSSPVFGHRTSMTVSDLVAMGLDFEDVKDLDDDAEVEDDTEKQARKGDSDSTSTDDPVSDPSLRRVLYTEVYMRVDFDGDGIAELRRICCGGSNYEILKNEPFEDIQFATFTPYPEAHTFFGQSVADKTMDIQRIKSRVLRDILDSLAQSITPATGVVEGQVNLDDVLNPDVSKIIRMRQPGMVQPFVIPFVGQQGLPILDLMDKIREQRTGMTDAAQGLDAKALQSTDKDAVMNTLSKGQARTEMLARNFAETGWKDLFKGILKLIVRHQDKARTVRLRGHWAEVQPNEWDPGMDAEVDLSGGNPREQIAFLQGILAKQEAILQMLGPDNPLVTLQQYRDTLARIIELGGFKNTSAFISDPAQMKPEELAAIKQTMVKAMSAGKEAPAGPAPVDPAIEQAKIKANMAIKQAELDFKREELATHAAIEQGKIQADMQMRAMEIEAKYKTTVDKAQLDHAGKQVIETIKSRTAIIVEGMKPKGGADNGSKAE